MKKAYEDLVKKDGKAIEFVPKEFLTEEMCENAVITDGRNLKLIPIEWRSPCVCAVAVTEWRYGGWVNLKQYIPENVVREVRWVLEDTSFEDKYCTNVYERVCKYRPIN